MITKPQCLEEIGFLLGKTREAGAPLSPRQALEMFTLNPSKVLNDKKLIARSDPIGEADLMVLELDPSGPGKTHDPYGVLNFLSSRDVHCVMSRETLYYPNTRWLHDR